MNLCLKLQYKIMYINTDSIIFMKYVHITTTLFLSNELLSFFLSKPTYLDIPK